MENVKEKTSLKRTRKKIGAFEIVMLTILIVHCVLVLGVFFWAIINSFNTGAMLGIPKKWGLENYLDMEFYMESFDPNYPYTLLEMFLHSFLYAGGSALFQVACTVVAAYCTAKYKGPVSSFTYNLVIVTIALPIVGGMASTLEVLTIMNLDEQMFGVWLIKFGLNSMYYLIFYEAFSSVSWEYAESAFVDGANHYTVFFQIMLPLVKSLIGAVFLLLFIGFWNDFETPNIFLEQPTLSVGLYGVINGYSTNAEGVRISMTEQKQIVAGIIVFLPIFIIFIAFRNKIMGNLTEGGIKA